jgi:hypothetical protein
MFYNTATFRHSNWLFHEAIRTPPSFDAYITHSSFRLSFIPSFYFHHSIPLPTNIRPLHMCKKHQDQLVHVYVHPPFPSFAWVMTAQANPPTPAYAYGYIQNAQALRTRPPAHRATPPGRHRSYPRSSRPPPSSARVEVEARDGKFMVGRSIYGLFESVAVDRG